MRFARAIAPATSDAIAQQLAERSLSVAIKNKRELQEPNNYPPLSCLEVRTAREATA